MCALTKKFVIGGYFLQSKQWYSRSGQMISEILCRLLIMVREAVANVETMIYPENARNQTSEPCVGVERERLVVRTPMQK